MNEITDLIGCKYPVIQGAMGVICNPEFVAAVSEAGGFGLLATAFQTDPDALKEQIRAVKRLTDQPFGANLMPINPLAPQFAEILVQAGIKAVTTSGGSPKVLAPYLKEHGVKVLHVVANVANARKAEAVGVDAIIAEGSESGGIQGFNGASTMVLTPMVVDAVSLPVVAAGGIGDSRGFRAALALGAKGVQVGTRFIASRECIAHENYKQTLVSSDETDTRLINVGWAQIRASRTPLVERMMGADGESGREDFTAIEGSLEESWVSGDLEAGPVPAGQIAGMIREVLSVREVIEEMVGG